MDAAYTGERIAELRKKQGLTQKELASKVHVTDKAVSKWERGLNFPDIVPQVFGKLRRTAAGRELRRNCV